MSEDDNDPRMTTEEARSAVNRFILTAEVEGFWEAWCECGQLCGQATLEPNAADAKYVACPACPRDGRDGGVKWVRVD